jgi:hypothetical protein
MLKKSQWVVSCGSNIPICPENVYRIARRSHSKDATSNEREQNCDHLTQTHVLDVLSKEKISTQLYFIDYIFLDLNKANLIFHCRMLQTTHWMMTSLWWGAERLPNWMTRLVWAIENEERRHLNQ